MSSYTATQFAEQALRDIGCLRPGQHTSTDVLNDILTTAQQMVDAWLLNELLVPFIRIDAYNLTAGFQVYTIGPNETASRTIEGITTKPIQATRPTKIEYANIILNTVSPVVRQEMRILRDPKEWGRLRVQQIPFAIPTQLYYDESFDPTNGYGIIYLWPGPQASYQLELFTWQQIQNFADLTTPYSFQPGYARFVRKSLGVEIAPMMRMYAKVPGPGGLRSYDPGMLEMVKIQARVAKQEVEVYNAPDTAVSVDPAFQGGKGRGAFNYGTGDIGGPR